jgi:hypothetical protein
MQPSRPRLIGFLKETGVDRLEGKCLQIGRKELHEEGTAGLFLESSEKRNSKG